MDCIVRDPKKYLALATTAKRTSEQNLMPPFVGEIRLPGTGCIPSPMPDISAKLEAQKQKDFDRDAAMYAKNKSRALGSTVFDLLYQRHRGDIQKEFKVEQSFNKGTGGT